MITRKNLTIGAIAFVAVTTHLAHAYQVDVEVTRVSLETEFESGDDRDNTSTISGQYYLSDIADNAALPYEELGEFSQISNLGLDIVYTDDGFGNEYGYELNGQVFIPDTNQFVYGVYGNDRRGIEQITLGYGLFFIENFQGRIGLFVQEVDEAEDNIEGDGFGANGSLAAVFAFSNGSYLATRGELTILSAENDDFDEDEDVDYANVQFEAALDFYPVKQLGLGIGLTSVANVFDDENDTSETETFFFLNANYHINELVNFRASYGFGEIDYESDFSFDQNTLDLNGFRLEAGFRF